MKNILSHKILKYLASIRFAIPVIFAFAACMIAGTILESKYGTQYAARKVYFTWWFFAILGGIVISVTLSMLARLPVKRRLLGFYIVHVSIVIIVIGAVVTRFTGLDGMLTLSPGQASGAVLHGHDHIYFYRGSTEFKLRLPTVAETTDLGGEEFASFGGNGNGHGNGHAEKYKIRALSYLPYAAEVQQWKKGGDAWVSRWLIKNAQFTERVELADRPLLDLKTSVEMGPLRIKAVSPAMLAELEKASQLASGRAPKPILIYDRTSREAYRIMKLPAKVELAGGRMIEVNQKSMHGGNLVFYSIETPEAGYRFFPKFSTLPVATDLTEQQDSRFELYDLSTFSESPTVLVAKSGEGPARLAYGKGDKWEFATYGDSPVSLPWMGISLTLMSERMGEVPFMEYAPAVPDKEESKNIRAALVEIEGPLGTERAWVSNRREFAFNDSRTELRGWINPEQYKLPWRLVLEDFKMDLIPGTQDPASYESFVAVASTGEKAHIFMNNPLKKDGYTLYQSSYFQDEQGKYHTVLSVNRDPGRPIKYAGSLLLIFGMILHFAILHGLVKFEVMDARLERLRMALGGLWKLGGEKA